MDEERFDRLIRSVGQSMTRRGALGAVVGLAAAGLSEAVALGRGRHHKDKHRHNERRDERRRGRNKAKRQSSHRATKAEATNCCATGSCLPGPGAYLAKCCLQGQNLAGQNFSRSNLSGASLAGATLTSANFNQANLQNACLVDADLTGATLTNANLRGAIFCRTRMPNGSINNSGCTKGTKCCPTCKPLGESGCNLGGKCCGGGICQGGACVCPTGQTNCGGVCKNLQTDPNNCGACGNTCTSGRLCCSGACTVAAWANQTTFGSHGSGASQFYVPSGVAVAADGQTAWVADTGNDRIAVWTKSGGAWSNLTTFGSQGSGASQFSIPFGVAVAADGQTAWVADTDNHRIAVWTKSGGAWSNLTTFGSGPGSGASQFSIPFGVAVAADGQTAWVADTGNHRIAVWTKSGGSWVNQTTFGSHGSGASQFDLPDGVAVAADGQTAWIADRDNHRISVWTKSGGSWANQTTFGSQGSGVSQFDLPFGVAVAADGQTAWVADEGNHRISVWTKSGGAWSNLTTFGSGPGSGASQFNAPRGVAMAADGQTVWVVHETNAEDFTQQIFEFKKAGCEILTGAQQPPTFHQLLEAVPAAGLQAQDRHHEPGPALP